MRLLLKPLLLSFSFLIFCIRLCAGDEFCSIRNTAFQNQESISYTIYYSVIGMYVNAGSATFTANIEKMDNKPVYHVVGTGSSNPSYDWIFKVRDKYESYIDTANLKPKKFLRSIDEGGYKLSENVTFNSEKNSATTLKGTLPVPNCVQDVLSSIYYARNINFNSYKPNDKIPFTMFLDNGVYDLYIKYLCKEVIKTRYGTFHSIKFKPLLVKGTIFQGGENMSVWVTDDANHIPVRIESPITVGAIKVDMMGFDKLRYPMSSLINRR